MKSLVRAMKTEAEEKQLIEAAQKDPIHFADLYEQHFDAVYAYIFNRVRNRAEAQDLTADVFHHALDNIKTYEWRGVSFAAWLYRIAANAIADHFRRNGHRPDALESTDHTPVVTEDAQQRILLFQLVNGLPADQRKVLLMRFADEKTVAEIARELKRTEGSIKQLQFRALKSLRSQMRNTHG